MKNSTHQPAVKFHQDSRTASVERLLARELGYCLAIREAGFSFEEFQISWPAGEQLPKVEESVEINRASAIQQLGEKEYIEKRISFLCARSYGEFLVIGKNATRDNIELSSGAFWDFLMGTPKEDIKTLYPSDYGKAYELATLYRALIENGVHISDSELAKKVQHDQVHRHIFNFGIAPLGNLLTEVEFLNLLDSLVKREVGAYGVLINSTIDIEEATVKNYSPGRNTLEFLNTEESEALSPRLDSCLDRIAPGEISPVIRCLFAHELGHWLAAGLLDFPTGEVKLDWKLTRLVPRCEGSCTMHLGNPAVILDFDDYLEKRIAILAAASLADCSTQFPTSKHIGIEFQKTLAIGTGKDDYQKILELFLIYRTRPRSIATKRGLPLDREPERSEIFESITKILQDLGIWEILRSEEYRSFVAVVIEAEQKRHEASWQHDERVSLVIPGDRLLDHLAAKEDLQELIKQVAAAAAAEIPLPPHRSVPGVPPHTAPAVSHDAKR